MKGLHRKPTAPLYGRAPEAPSKGRLQFGALTKSSAELPKQLAQLELLKELTQLNAKHQAVFSLWFQGLVAAGMPSCKPRNRIAVRSRR